VVTFAVLRSRNDAGPTDPVLWSTARAESRIQAACDGRGRARLDGGRRLYKRFSCDITVVRPSGDCKSSGVYFCVAGFESTVLTRSIRAIDGTRYLLR
jgi:hypothetical protein